MPETFQFKVARDEVGRRLDVFLAQHVKDLSRSRIEKLIEAGQVRVEGRTQKRSYALEHAQIVDIVVPDPEPAGPVAQDIPLDVLYEDEDIFVINKAPGMAVHPGAGRKDGTMVNALLGRRSDLSGVGGVLRPGIVHRLDKDTSGLMLAAKNDLAHTTLSKALERRDIHRKYWAIALRAFDHLQGSVSAPIGRHPTVRTRMAVREDEGRYAKTRWRVLEQFRGFTLVECTLETGRTHQIRVHLSHIRHPVLGDDVYGGAPAVGLQLVPPGQLLLREVISNVGRQMLHARELRFYHPRTAEPMTFEANLPSDFQCVLDELRRAYPPKLSLS